MLDETEKAEMVEQFEKEDSRRSEDMWDTWYTTDKSIEQVSREFKHL